MDYSQLYSKYYSRMSREGWLKSAFCALIVGFAANGIIALVTWLVGFDMGLWIALGGLVVVTAAVTPVFYFRVFRPTEKKVAKRLDSLGLDERIITMIELEGDTSEIAALQRADAVGKFQQADNEEQKNSRFTRFKMPIGVIVAAACVGVFGITFTVINILSNYGGLPDGKSVLNVALSKPATYEVSYGIHGVKEKNDEDENGEISKEKLAAYMAYALAAGKNDNNDEEEIPATVTFGEVIQKVKAGQSSKDILYTANDYFYFVKWVDNFDNEYSYVDGYTPMRHEENVNYDIKLKVCFEKVDECLNDDEMSRYFVGGGGGNAGGGGGGSANNLGDKDYELNRFDYIIDGKTKYMTDYDVYYDLAMKYLSESENLSGEERAMIETYFGILK